MLACRKLAHSCGQTSDSIRVGPIHNISSHRTAQDDPTQAKPAPNDSGSLCMVAPVFLPAAALTFCVEIASCTTQAAILTPTQTETNLRGHWCVATSLVVAFTSFGVTSLAGFAAGSGLAGALGRVAGTFSIIAESSSGSSSSSSSSFFKTGRFGFSSRWPRWASYA